MASRPDTHFKGTLMGTPHRERKGYSSNITGIYIPESLYSIIFLLHSWGSLFEIPIKVPLHLRVRSRDETMV